MNPFLCLAYLSPLLVVAGVLKLRILDILKWQPFRSVEIIFGSHGNRTWEMGPPTMQASILDTQLIV